MVDGNGQRWAPAVLHDAGEDDSDDGYVVGVRESADPQSWSLLLMECVDPGDKQTVAHGMDTYCLVVDPGQATHYGGVLACELTDTQLRLALSDAAAEALAMPTDVTFALAFDQPRRLRGGLIRVLTSGRTDEIPRHLHT